MLNVENVATPPLAATVAVPESVPPPALVPIATVTFPVNPVAVLLLASSAVTCTAGVIAAPADVVLGSTENTSCVAVPAVMLNAVLVALPAPVAVSVYPVPTLSIDSPANVATPPDAAWVAVPDKAPPDGLVPMASVTLPVNPVAVLLLASRAVTCTAGVIVAPADVVLGSTENTSCVAVPAVMLNAVLVALPAPVAVSVYPVPTLSIDSPANVATPPDAAWVAVPDKAPPDGLVPMASVTLPVNPVAVLLLASRAVTCTAGVIVAPADVVLGSTENTSCVAVPAVMLNAVLVALPAPVAVSVYPVPTLSIDSPANVATPPDAAWVAVPDKAPPDGLVPMASVTLPVNPVAVLLLASSAVTRPAALTASPADVVLGCTENTSCVAVPAVMLNAVLVALPAPVAVSV